MALIALAAFSCRPAGPGARPAAVPPAGLPVEEPTVRVGIVVDTPEVSVAASGGLVIEASGGERIASPPEDEELRFVASGDAIEVRDASGALQLRAAGPVAIRSGDGDVVQVGGRPYRGGALVRIAGPGRLTAINVVRMEHYLLGVVPHEIGERPESEIEAVKAQAVAARTYAMVNLGGRESLGFDFHATVADQVYRGLEREDPVSARAVRETRGQILVHDGSPVLAFYHSTCGGHTAAIDQVWRRAPLPYLRSVSDRDPRSGRDYCEISNRYRWSESWTAEELAHILGRTLAEHTGRPERPVRRVEAVEVLGRTESGRVDVLRIRADGEEYRARGDSLRWVLRPDRGRILNSAAIQLEPEVPAGELRGLTVRGAGWGHGIGMCQMGAVGRARAGQGYRDILGAYYRGATVFGLY